MLQQTGAVCKSFLPVQMRVLWESVPPWFQQGEVAQVWALCALSHGKEKVVKSVPHCKQAAQDIMIQTSFSEEFRTGRSVLWSFFAHQKYESLALGTWGCLLTNDWLGKSQSGKETTGEVKEVYRVVSHLEKQDSIPTSKTKMDPSVSLELCSDQM